jgi:hypothetical protein
LIFSAAHCISSLRAASSKAFLATSLQLTLLHRFMRPFSSWGTLTVTLPKHSKNFPSKQTQNEDYDEAQLALQKLHRAKLQ